MGLFASRGARPFLGARDLLWDLFVDTQLLAQNEDAESSIHLAFVHPLECQRPLLAVAPLNQPENCAAKAAALQTSLRPKSSCM